MKIDIVDLNKFVDVNECPEVTNPIYLDLNNIPTDDGLFSYVLFGLSGSYDRKTIFGYIDLKKRFLHPVIYRLLVSIDRRIAKVVDGSLFVSLDEKGIMIKDDEKGKTGLDFLYKNFDKIKFKQTDSRVRAEKISVFEAMKKNEAFIDKWLVIPAFYRDVNLTKSGSGKIGVDEINSLYTKILSISNTLDSNSGYDFMGSISEGKLQLYLLEIYEMLTKSMAKKTGIIRQSLMGKSVDYATRAVISAPRINSQKWDEQAIPFGYTGVPLAQLLVLYYPFFIYEITTYFEEIFNTTKFIYDKDKDKQNALVNPMDDYTPDKIKKLMNIYIKSIPDRFMKLEVNTDNKKKNFLAVYEGDKTRVLTLTDLLYVVANRVCADKLVYITRYPMETHQGIYPSKIKILTTYKTHDTEVNSTYFEDYPYVDASMPVTDSTFIDTVVMNNSYLDALGGDYDGDMVSLRAVWSQEANNEAKELLNSNSNLLNSSGENVRTLGNEAVQTMFALTRD